MSSKDDNNDKVGIFYLQPVGIRGKPTSIVCVELLASVLLLLMLLLMVNPPMLRMRRMSVLVLIMFSTLFLHDRVVWVQPRVFRVKVMSGVLHVACIGLTCPQ